MIIIGVLHAKPVDYKASLFQYVILKSDYFFSKLIIPDSPVKEIRVCWVFFSLQEHEKHSCAYIYALLNKVIHISRSCFLSLRQQFSLQRNKTITSFHQFSIRGGMKRHHMKSDPNFPSFTGGLNLHFRRCNTAAADLGCSLGVTSWPCLPGLLNARGLFQHPVPTNGATEPGLLPFKQETRGETNRLRSRLILIVLCILLRC